MRLGGLIALIVLVVGMFFVGRLAYLYFSETPEDMGEGAAGTVGRVADIAQRCDAPDTDCLAVASDASFFVGNTLVTNDTGALDAELLDGTSLTLGNNSNLLIDNYFYQPRTAGTFVSYLFNGCLRIVSGDMSGLSDKDIRVETPVASTSARGTDFWVGEIDGNFAVLLLDGEVVVTTDGGEAVLDDPGEGVTIFSREEAPSEVRVWPDEKRERALNMVSF